MKILFPTLNEMHHAAFFVILSVIQFAFSREISKNNTLISCKPTQCTNSSISGTNNCFCDDQCSFYGDCCPDYKPDLIKIRNTLKNVPNLSNITECISEGLHGFYMVTSCPQTWNNVTISKKCQKSKRFFDNKINPNSNIESVPIISKNITYGNKYCAICNGVQNDFKHMELQMNCHFIRRIDQPLPDMSCRFRDPYDDNARTCYTNVIDTCHSDWNDTEVANRCHSYTTYVFSIFDEDAIFKNPDCAYCNFQNDTTLSFCQIPRRFYADIQSPPRGTFPDLFNTHGHKNCTKIEMESSKSYIPTLGVLMSIIFLIFHLIIFSLVETMRNFSGKCVSSFVVALLLGYVCYCLWGFEKGLTCLIIAITTYYSFLAAFFWMLVISIDVSIATYNASCMLVRHKDANDKKFIFYSIFCWGVPLIFVAFALVVEFHPVEYMIPKPSFGQHDSCWFGSGNSLLFFFVLPCSFIMTVNIVLFTWTSYLIFSNRKETSTTLTKDHGDYKLYGRLAVLMGLTWMTGIMANYFQFKDLWIIFSLLNTTQGIFIFTAFSCKENNIREIKKKYSITFM